MFSDDYKGCIQVPTADFAGSYGNSGRVVARPPTGGTYIGHQLRFTIAGAAATRAQIATQVALLRFLLDANVLYEATGTDACDLVDFYRPGTAGLLGILPVRWFRPWQELQINQDGPAFGTQGNDSFACEISFVAAAVTIDKVDMTHMSYSGELLGEHVALLRQSYNYAGTGLQTISDIPRPDGFGYYAIHLAPPSGGTSVLSLVELLCDNQRIAYGVPDVIHARLKESTSSRTPQANWRLHLDFCWRNRHGEYLPTSMGDLRLNLTWATAAPGTFSLYLEQYRKPPAKRVA